MRGFLAKHGRVAPDVSKTYDYDTGLDARIAVRLGVNKAFVTQVVDAIVDEIGWDEIHAFQEELYKGQSIYEDAGGYFVRAIRGLLGKKSSPIINYRLALQTMLEQADRKEK